jgi:excisionase family DNA binding protein
MKIRTQQHREPPAPIAYSIADAMRVVGFGRSKLYELLTSGELASVKHGRRRLILREDLEAMLKRYRTAA